MNKQELVAEVKRLITLHHDHFDMSDWTNGVGKGDLVDKAAMVNGCGTTGCIAAWTVLAAGGKVVDGNHTDSGKSVMETAASLLGSPSPDLWFSCDWPDDLNDRHNRASDLKDTVTMAALACEAIDYFIPQEN